jgi:hypothetical protein
MDSGPGAKICCGTNTDRHAPLVHLQAHAPLDHPLHGATSSRCCARARGSLVITTLLGVLEGNNAGYRRLPAPASLRNRDIKMSRRCQARKADARIARFSSCRVACPPGHEGFIDQQQQADFIVDKSHRSSIGFFTYLVSLLRTCGLPGSRNRVRSAHSQLQRRGVRQGLLAPPVCKDWSPI